MKRHEPPAWLPAYIPVCEAISRLFHPYAEVVIHDLANDRIVALWNPFSGRKVGDPALLEELPESASESGVYGPYAKVMPDGRNLSSVSSVLVDAAGRRCGLLCVNFDRSPFDGMAELLTRFAVPTTPRPPELFNRAWRERIALVVDEECRARQLRRSELTREDRLSLVGILDEQELFATRQAASHAAAALGVSRATVYAMIKEFRKAGRRPVQDVPG